MKQAAPIAASLYGGSSLELAAVLSDLSGAQRALGNRKEAKLSLESAIRMRDERPAEHLPSSPAIWQSPPRLSWKWRTMARRRSCSLGRSPRAIRLFHPIASNRCPFSTRLQACFATIPNIRQAEPLYVRALRMREAAFGRDSAELISTLDSLAYVYFGMERYASAPASVRALTLVVGINRRPGSSDGRADSRQDVGILR